MECARLIVPMDYSNTASNQTVALALIKLPATDTENYLGPIFFQPGVSWLVALILKGALRDLTYVLGPRSTFGRLVLHDRSVSSKACGIQPRESDIDYYLFF